MTIIEQIKAEIEKLIKRYGSVKAKGILQEGYKGGRLIGYEDVLNILKRIQEGLEKPMNQDGLDENIKHYIEDCGWGKDSTIPVSFVRQIASHFYNLGCRRTAEKYDEIEYNRQKAEEQGSKGLEEEIIKCWQEWISPSNKQSVEGVLPLSEFAFYARHFAQWGAEHFRDLTKKMGDSSEIPADLEEAAWDCVLDNIDVNNPVLLPKYKELLTCLLIAGAKWDREQMMSNAVEGRIFMSFAPGHNQMVMADVDLPTNTKVRVIIIKEDEK